MCVPGLAAYLRAAADGMSDTELSDIQLTDSTRLVDDDRSLVSATRTTATEGRA